MEIYNLHLANSLYHNGTHAVIEKRKKNSEQTLVLWKKANIFYAFLTTRVDSSNGKQSVFLKFNVNFESTAVMPFSIWLLFQNAFTRHDYVSFPGPAFSLSNLPKGIEFNENEKSHPAGKKRRKKKHKSQKRNQKVNIIATNHGGWIYYGGEKYDRGKKSSKFRMQGHTFFTRQWSADTSPKEMDSLGGAMKFMEACIFYQAYFVHHTNRE